MVHHDIFGAKLAQKDKPTEPVPGGKVGHTKRIIFSSTNGEMEWRAPITLNIGATYYNQATFFSCFRVIPETGELCPFTMTIAVQSGNFRYNYIFKCADTQWSGRNMTALVYENDMDKKGTSVGAVYSSDRPGLFYSSINGGYTIQPGTTYCFEAHHDGQDEGLRKMRINGKYIPIEYTTAVSMFGTGEDIGTGNYVSLKLQTSSAIPLTLEFFNILGRIEQPAGTTDGMEWTEPLVNYNDLGAPTADDAAVYYPADFNGWQLNWNSITDPYGNVGDYRGTFVPQGAGYPPITLVEEEQTLNRISPDKDAIIRYQNPSNLTGVKVSRGYDPTEFLDATYIGDNTPCFCIFITTTSDSNYIYRPLSSWGSGLGVLGNAQFNSMFGLLTESEEIIAGGKVQIASNWYYGDPQGYWRRSEEVTAKPRNMVITSWMGGAGNIIHFVYNKTQATIRGRQGLANSGTNMDRLAIFSDIGQNIGTETGVLYAALYSQTTVTNNPQIPWASDGMAMHNYFYKTGSNEVVNDLVNAIPAVRPTVILYNARATRGVGLVGKNSQKTSLKVGLSGNYAVHYTVELMDGKFSI